MKTLLLTAVMVFAGASLVSAQSLVDRNLKTDLETQKAPTPLVLDKPKPNEIRVQGLKVRGALVQLVKTDNPLQLINPFAPASYGSGRDNLNVDPVTGRPSGVMFVSVQF